MTRRRSETTVGAPRPSWRLRHVAFLARLVAFFVSLHLSGAATVVGPLVYVDDASDCCEESPEDADCPMESDGRGCPPGCPKCHGVQAGIALPPAAFRVETPVVQVRRETSPAPDDTLNPHAPALRGPYRPPRFCASA